MTFSLALPSWLLKLPFQFTTAPRKRNQSSRKAMHLKYWPAAFELRANFNLDEMTSRIRGQAPKHYPKWRRPMTNFLLLQLERNFIGIGCTMDAQTVVSNSTQCGLCIGEYKKCTHSGVIFSFNNTYCFPIFSLFLIRI